MLKWRTAKDVVVVCDRVHQFQVKGKVVCLQLTSLRKRKSACLRGIPQRRRFRGNGELHVFEPGRRAGNVGATTKSRALLRRETSVRILLIPPVPLSTDFSTSDNF